MGPLTVSVRALAVLLVGLSAGSATAQSPDATRGTPGGKPPDAVVGPPSGIQRFQIRQDTPAEREAFLKRRQARTGKDKPEEVPPLPAQRITPLASSPQR